MVDNNKAGNNAGDKEEHKVDKSLAKNVTIDISKFG